MCIELVLLAAVQIRKNASKGEITPLEGIEPNLTLFRAGSEKFGSGRKGRGFSTPNRSQKHASERQTGNGIR